MAKVLISPIGVGPNDENVMDREYKTAIYKFTDSDETYETSFVASAIAKHYKVDKILLIGTSRSMWEKVYEYFSEQSELESNMDYWVDLATRVGKSKNDRKLVDNKYLEMTNNAIDAYLKKNRKDAAGGSKCYIIDYGLCEEEIWNNFDMMMSITEYLNNGDEIYLDITHSFRSIPLFMYLIFDFIKNLQVKDIKLAGLMYGMLEVKHEGYDYAPVIDLSPLFQISEWIRATHEFINYGNGYLISELLANKKLKKTFREVSDAIGINYLKKLRESIIQLDSLLKNINLEDMPVLKYINPYVLDFMKTFRSAYTHAKFQLELAKWNFENKNFATGYLCLRESMVTRMGEIYKNKGIKIDVLDYNIREDKIKNIFYRFSGSNIEIYNLYKSISGKRNNIAHAGFSDEEIKLKEDIESGQNWCKKVEELLFNNKSLDKLVNKYPYEEL